MLSNIYLNGVLLEVIQFSGGEVQVVIPESSKFFPEDDVVNIIKAHIKCSSGLMVLSQLVDLLRHNFGTKPTIRLELPYVPYGRYDRRMSPVDSHSLKVFATMINSLDIQEVIVEDAHSYVTEAVFNNVHAVSQLNCLKVAMENSDFNLNLHSYSGFVAPDDGSTKKVGAAAQEFNKNLIKCDKTRDEVTKRIKDFTILSGLDHIENANLLIMDDICDGGGTFVGLAEELKKRGASRVDLYVTHGIFSKGIDPLLKHIDNVYTTYSWLECPRVNYSVLY